MFLWLAVLLFVIFVLGFRFYLSPPTKWCQSQRCLVGKTVLITGANTGLGFEVALDFAKRGAKIILACRDEEKGEKARMDIMDRSDNHQVFLKTVDMSSFRSVKQLAKDILEQEDRLDILINNAGMTFAYGTKSEDNLDLVMQVNYYSHFLLTILLIPLLKTTTNSRIINVASLAAAYAKKFQIENLESGGNLDQYANSKLCNILFTQELSKKLSHSNVTTFSLHPGAIKTGIFRNTKGLHTVAINLFMTLFYKSLEYGTQTIIFCALEKGIEKYSGHHFDNCRRVETYKTARCPKLAPKLWRRTEQVLGLEKTEL